MAKAINQAEDILRDELAPGEQVIWSGGVTRTSNAIYWQRMRVLAIGMGSITVILIAVVMAFIFAVELSQPGYTIQRALSKLAPVFGALLVAFLIAIVVMIGASILAIRLNQPDKRTLYVVTNQRALIITPSRRLVVSLDKGKINVIRRIEQPDGTGTLYFGTGTMAPAFLGIAHVRDVERLIRANAENGNIQ